MGSYKMDGDSYVSEHFRLVEFTNTKATEAVKFKSGQLFPVLLDALEYLRERMQPLKASPKINITSGYRTASFNASVGGSPNSEHLDAHAADIELSEEGIPAAYQPAAELIWREAAEKFGFIGTFGYYDTHTHLGVDGGRNGRTSFYTYDKRKK